MAIIRRGWFAIVGSNCCEILNGSTVVVGLIFLARQTMYILSSEVRCIETIKAWTRRLCSQSIDCVYLS